MEKGRMAVQFRPKIKRIDKNYRGEDIDFRPYNAALLSDAAKNVIIANRNQVLAGHNTADFYVHLYRALFDGEILRNEIGGISLREMAGEKLFCPDLERVGDNGTVYTEVKSISVKNSSPHCSLKQVENYFGAFMDRVASGEEGPGVEYAFFRYATTYVNKVKGKRRAKGRPLHLRTNDEHFEKLCGETRDLLVVPLNLAFFIFLNSPTERMDQTSSDGSNDEQKVLRPIGGFLTDLREGQLEKLRGRKYRESEFGLYADEASKAERYLMLDGLEYQTMISEHVSARLFGKHELEQKVEPFRIYAYSMKEDAASEWNKWLREKRNRAKICKALNIKDPVPEGVPF